MIKKWLQRVCLGLLVVTLMSCNSIGVGYYFGERFLLSIIDDYLDLSATQSEWLQGRLQAHIQWHKQTELPIYIDNLSQWQRMLKDGITPIEAAQVTQDLNDAYLRMMNRIKPDSATLFTMLDEQQIDHLSAYLETTRQARLEEQATQTPKKQYADFKERMVLWFGDFSKPQEQQLKPLFDAWQSQRQNATQTDQQRTQSQQTFIAFLRTKPNETQASQWLDYWFRYWQMPQPEAQAPDARAIMALNSNNKRQQGLAKIPQRIQQVDKLITLKQRKFVSQKVQSWINKMRAIIE